MDAIVSGKVEKAEGSLGVFKSIFKANIPENQNEVYIENIPEFLQNVSISVYYYIKFNVNSAYNFLAISSLYFCRIDNPSVTSILPEVGGINLGTWIEFNYFRRHNKIGITTNISEPVRTWINSIEIGTLG